MACVAARAPAGRVSAVGARPVGRPFVSQSSCVPCARAVVAAAASVEAEVVEAKGQEVQAVLRYAKGAPNKVRRVLDTIRGRPYEEALMILEYMPYRACEPILKCLVSAAANAKNNYDMKKSNLVISTAYADMGPKMKRFRCGDRGKPRPYSKLTSHITIKVSERPAEALN